MSAAYVREAYGVDFKVGDWVVVNGRRGVVVSFPESYVGVRFAGERRTTRCHPTWRIEKEADMKEQAERKRLAKIEVMAEALANRAAREGENWYTDDSGEVEFPRWDQLPDGDEYMGDSEWPIRGRDNFRSQAEAALSAWEAYEEGRIL